MTKPSSPRNEFCRLGMPFRLGTRSSAFALVAVLSLLVLIVLLLLSLGQILRVETRSSAAALSVERARGMALFGMEMALGQLQTLAGPDQRVTATADLLGAASPPADTSKKHWTGIWNAATYDPANPGSREFLGWLVSSPQPLTAIADAEGPLPLSSIELVGEASVGATDPTDRIFAPVVPVLDADSNLIGEFAYWVGDEGVKARFNLPQPTELDPNSKRRRLDFMASQRHAPELFGVADSVVTRGIATDPRSSRMTTREQISILGASADATRRHFHDTSLWSRGILTDTANGGLRKDLTWLFEVPVGTPLTAALTSIDADAGTPGSQITSDWPTNSGQDHWFPAPTFELLRSFYRFKDEAAPVQARKQTATQHGITPVITTCRMFFRPGVRVDSGQSFLRVNLDMQVVLWNPYNVPIAGREYDLELVLDSFDLALEADGTDRGRLHEMAGAAGRGFQDYDNIFAAGATGKSVTFRLPAVTIPAGESRIFSVADSEDGAPYSGSNFLANQPPDSESPNTVWMEHPVPLNQVPPIPNFRLRRQPSANSSQDLSGRVISISLKDPGTGGNNASAEYWTRTGRRASEGSGAYVDPQPLPLPDALVSPTAGHIQQVDSSLWTGNGYRNERWIANYNPRAIVVDQSHVDVFNNPTFTFQWRRAGNRVEFAGNDFDGGRVRVLPAAAPRFELTLFDIPTDSLPRMSLADFQHANVHPASTSNAYLIGNSLIEMRLENGSQTRRLPTGGRSAATHGPVIDGSLLLNRALWDRYFLSTIPVNYTDADLQSGRLLPNARMVPRAGARVEDLKHFDDASANLMLEGAFNVNSTSVEAWKAVLGSRRGLEFDPVTGASGGALEAGFSRLSRPQGAENEPWLGFRSLSDAQVQTFAERMVDEVRERGPFMSIADFVNRQLGSTSDPRVVKGAIGRAIDNANLNSNATQGLPGAGNDGSNWNPAGQPQAWYLEEALIGSRHEGATTWITQGDVLQAIGGAIAVRSDTFVIRSFGRTYNRVGDLEAEVWCEAVVQRDPEPIEASSANPNEPADPNRLGRQFKIVSFRWIDRDAL